MPEPAEADLFLVPLLDGGHGLGQVAAVAGDGAVTALLTLSRETAPRALASAEVIARVVTTATPFQTGHWPITGYEALPRGHREAPSLLEDPPEPTDPAIVEALLNACHGLYPWNGFPEADFFDRMLLPGVAPPPARRMAADFP